MNDKAGENAINNETNDKIRQLFTKQDGLLLHLKKVVDKINISNPTDDAGKDNVKDTIDKDNTNNTDRIADEREIVLDHTLFIPYVFSEYQKSKKKIMYCGQQTSSWASSWGTAISDIKSENPKPEKLESNNPTPCVYLSELKKCPLDSLDKYYDCVLNQTIKFENCKVPQIPLRENKIEHKIHSPFWKIARLLTQELLPSELKALKSGISKKVSETLKCYDDERDFLQDETKQVYYTNLFKFEYRNKKPAHGCLYAPNLLTIRDELEIVQPNVAIFTALSPDHGNEKGYFSYLCDMLEGRIPNPKISRPRTEQKESKVIEIDFKDVVNKKDDILLFKVGMYKSKTLECKIIVIGNPPSFYDEKRGWKSGGKWLTAENKFYPYKDEIIMKLLQEVNRN